MEAISRHSELDPFLNDVDYTDIKQIDADTNLREFIAGMLSYCPWWMVLLFRVRKILVNLLGLVKHEIPEDPPSLSPEDVSFTPGDQVTFFVVRKGVEERYWVSETLEDKHLTAFFGVVADRLSSGMTRFTVITTIRYLHWSGPVYFNLIRPFHHLVVWRMMKTAANSKAKGVPNQKRRI